MNSPMYAGMTAAEVRGLVDYARDRGWAAGPGVIIPFEAVVASQPAKPEVKVVKVQDMPARILRLLRDFVTQHESDFDATDFELFLSRSRIRLERPTIVMYLKMGVRDKIITIVARDTKQRATYRKL